MDIAANKTQDVRVEIRITWYQGPEAVRDQVCTDAMSAAARALGVPLRNIRQTNYPNYPVMKSYSMESSAYRYPNGMLALLPDKSPMVETQEATRENTNEPNAPNENTK